MNKMIPNFVIGVVNRLCCSLGEIHFMEAAMDEPVTRTGTRTGECTPQGMG